MKTWPALVIAPLLVLAEQSVALALAPWACARQAGGWLHAVPAVFLLATIAIAAAATLARAHAPPGRETHARIAVAMGWFSVLVLLALWLPLWGIEPCRG